MYKDKHLDGNKKSLTKNIPWFTLGIIGLFLFSLILRFWEISRFNTLVFDEVYNAKFANDFLNQTPFFDAHPPVEKYIIAIGIWLGNILPFGKDIVNNLTGSELSTFSYRWINALTGSFIPLVVAGIAYQLSYRRSYALIAGLFAAVDGLLLVESRYALNNIYLVIFGLLGQWLFLLALDRKYQRKKISNKLLRIFSAICFGVCIAVKWNGLGFLLGIYLIWIFGWVIQQFKLIPAAESDVEETEETQDTILNPNECLSLRAKRSNRRNLEIASFHSVPLAMTNNNSCLQNLTRVNFKEFLFYWGVIPALVYYLAWIPYLLVYPESGFWELHQKMSSFHTVLGDGQQVHQYCSRWYTWPWMIRPMAYFFAKVDGTSDSVSNLGFPVSVNPGETIIFDVHGMGNPILYWLSSVAIILALGILIYRIAGWLGSSRTANNQPLFSAQIAEFWILLYVILNYAANWLPWMKVSRCTFLYHYMSASIFAFLCLAWIIEHWLRSYIIFLRIAAITVIFAILQAFVFWLPIYLGLTLSEQEFYLRMWFQTWI